VTPIPTGTAIPTGYASNATTPSAYWYNTTSASSTLTTIVTVTDVYSTTTTVCPYESEYTSGSSTLTSTGTTTSTITTSYQSTITITATVPVVPTGYGSGPSSTPVSPVSDTPSPGGYGGDEGSSAPAPVSYVQTSESGPETSGYHITVSIPEIGGGPSTLAPVPYGSYTPSGYESSPSSGPHGGRPNGPPGGHPEGPHGGRPNGPYGGAPHTTVIVTDTTTSYTTVCPYEETHTSGGVTSTSTGTTTSTITSSYQTTLTLTVSPSSSSPVGPVTPTTGSGIATPPSYHSSSSPSGYTTTTDITTTYTTPCTETTTYTSSGSTITSTYTTESTVTSTIHSTITVSLTSTTTVSASSSTSASVSGPVTGSSSSISETSYTTYTTTCSESGTTTLHTHSAPIYPNSSIPVYPSGSYSISTTPVVGPTGGSSTSSSVSGPVTGSSSTSYSQSSYTTFETTCTENGTTTLHTHSQPITYSANSTTPVVGPTGGSSSSSSAPSGSVSYSGNSSTPVVGPTGSVSSSQSSYTTYTTTCSENGTSVIHTHSAPITTGPSSSIPSNSANATSSFPTAPITASSSSSSSVSTTSSSSTSSSSTCGVKPTPSACIPCEGQPGPDPEKWCGYTANDDPYAVMPQTCRTVYYDFEITNSTVSPDGIERLALVVNGQFPGPLLEANWGDTVVVNVKNSMQNNGSTIHWHGIRQNYTNEMDGVASITQCPIAPGDSMTYTWRASNYGFSWYHAHYAIQAYEGVLGPMVINGPTSYDGQYEQDIEDEILVLNDWSHVPVDEMYDASQTVGPTPEHGPRVMDTGLINGMNIWGGADDSEGTTGQRYTFDVVPGETKRLRLLNSAIQSTFIVTIDGHSFDVVANDFVPIVPYTTTSVALNPGQRYDILVTFNQTSGNYWLRADNQNECATTTDWDNIKAIVHYVDAPTGVPTTTAQTYTAGCRDEPLSSLVPYYAMDAGVTKGSPNVETVTIAGNAQNLYKWSLNGVTFQSEWGSPTLESIYTNGTVPTYSGPLAVSVPNLGEWVYFIIQSPIPFPHPIHLHGHDFYVLAQGTGLYSSSVPLNLKNPARRDTAMMPWNPQQGQGGYLVIAYLADNPGAWLMHCHIGWHNAMGKSIVL
jgi:FtsP/CotA-like multicopper oxidase with cupredoxin domain